MPQYQDNRRPSKGPNLEVTPKAVLAEPIEYARIGSYIVAAETRDPSNDPAFYLQAGMPMGKLSTGGFAPSTVGGSTVAYTSGGTTLTVSVASAIELDRRLGSSGTFQIWGQDGDTVIKKNVTFSAVNTGNGEITVVDIGDDLDVGAWVQVKDGSENIRTIYDGFNRGNPERLTNWNTNDNQDLQFKPAMEAWVIDSAVTFWPAEGAFRDDLYASLNVNGKFFSYDGWVG